MERIIYLFKEFIDNKKRRNLNLNINEEETFKRLIKEYIKTFLDITNFLPFEINRAKKNGIDTKRNNKYNQEIIKYKISDYYENKLIIENNKLNEIEKYSFIEIEEFAEKKRDQRLEVFLKRREIELDTSLDDYKLKENYIIEYMTIIYQNTSFHISKKAAKYNVDSEYFKSKYEANFYIKYIYEIRKKYNIELQYEYKIYDETMGKRTVDFFVPPFEKDGKLTKGLFVEVTSFNEKTRYSQNYKMNQIRKNNCAVKNNCNFILVTPNGKKDFDLTFVIMEDNKDKMSKEIDFKKYMKQNYNIDYENKLYHDGSAIVKKQEITLGL